MSTKNVKQYTKSDIKVGMYLMGKDNDWAGIATRVDPVLHIDYAWFNAGTNKSAVVTDYKVGESPVSLLNTGWCKEITKEEYDQLITKYLV